MVISAENKILELARNSLDDGKAVDLICLDVRGLTAVTDYMLICSGTSVRHVKALAENLVKNSKDAGFQPQGVEGLDQGEWVLVDLGGVVAHVMQQQTRAFYQLEKLWSLGAAGEDAEAREGA